MNLSKVVAQRFSGLRFLILGSVAMMFIGCSTTRQMEQKQTNAAYETLGLKKEGNDNVMLYREAASWMHVPHVDGGSSRNGTDCSFLVYSIYRAVYNKTLERNSQAMLNKNCRRIGRHQLKEGDLVFFNTGSNPGFSVSHVGIYLKNHKFLHASTQKGVHVSDLDENYYRKAWICGGRVK